MKKIIISALMLILLVSVLTSCIIIPLRHNFEINADEVESVEIYDLRGKDTLYGDFVETEKPVYKIPADKKSDFLGDLAKIKFSDSIIIVLAAIDPSFYYGEWTVRINYNDDSFELISSEGFGEKFDENGEKTDSRHWGCGCDEWKEFLSNYVPADIFGVNEEWSEALD